MLSLAQHGPGGVGTVDGSSDLVLWLKANDINQISGTNVISWPDASGYGNNALAGPNSPLLLSNQINGNASVNFSSSLQQSLVVNHDGSLNSDYVTVFVIGRMNDSTSSKSSFLIKTSGNSMDDGYGLIRMNSKEKIRFFAGNYGVNRDSEHFHYGLFDLMVGNYRSGSSDKITALVNNMGSSTTAVGTSITSLNNLYIGARPGNSGLKSFLDGDIAEIVIMASDLPSTQRIIISNYLAAKYGFAISNDKYSYHSTHPQDVIGIGRYNDYTHESSKAGIVEIAEKPSKPLQNGSFLLVGHDGGSMNTITTNLPTEFSQRFTRTWRSHSNGYITKEKLIFHVDGMGMPTNTDDYALLLDYDGDGDFSNADVITPNNYNISQNTVIFNNIHLHTGAVFTLAFYKAITWDGISYTNGSGPSEAPNSQDGGRKLIVNAPNAVISSEAHVHNVEIKSGADLSIDSTICFKIETSIHNDGDIYITEDACLIQNTEGEDLNTGSGLYTVKQTGLNSNHGYNNWSSPMKHQELEVAFPDVNPCDLLTYSAFLQDWKHDFPNGYSTTCVGNPVTFNASNNIVGGDGFMNIGRGYFITGNTTNPQKMFNGKINNGDIKTLLVATNFGHHQNWDDDDWNFVGNPYPSALNPFAFWQENAVDHERITDALYFWDDAGTAGAAYDQYNDYSSWNLTGGIASDNSSRIIDSLNHIGVAQGFMVWASDQGVDSIGNFGHGPGPDTLYLDTLVFNNSMRSCQNGIFFKQQQKTKELAWLQIETPSGEKSKLLLGSVDGATDNMDNGYDARRNKLNSNKHVEISSMIIGDTTSLHIQAINPLDALNSNKYVPLKIVSDEGGVHTISREAYQKGGAPLKMYLKDNLLNITHDLDNGLYSFHLSTNTRTINRFEIVFEYDALNNQSGGSKGGVTSIQEIDDYFDIISIKNGFTITSKNGISGTISVFDVAGHKVYNETLMTKTTTKTVQLNESTGLYIIQVTDLNGEVHSKKSIIQ